MKFSFLPFLLAEGLAINYTSSANPSIWYKGGRKRGRKKRRDDVGNKPWEGRPRFGPEPDRVILDEAPAINPKRNIFPALTKDYVLKF